MSQKGVKLTGVITKRLEVDMKMKSGMLKSVEIKSHFGLGNQLGDTIGQALKELVVRRIKVALETARVRMRTSPLFTKTTKERLMMSLKSHRGRKRVRQPTTSWFSRQPLERSTRELSQEW